MTESKDDAKSPASPLRYISLPRAQLIGLGRPVCKGYSVANADICYPSFELGKSRKVIF
ncbi:hypothetical protein H4W81_008543 [Nonomuraea africana]|uniref:Uncharacterized protein n=1 Tax=Nonomuraea africana TaxID=46171 RepID=A0ABR9KUP1_9ACTN|nr:hypothetical protein [Nonomuraea africana]